MYKKGTDLLPGDRVALLSGEAGIATLDQANVKYIVTNAKDKKGNPQLVDLDTGLVSFATPHSVWVSGV